MIERGNKPPIKNTTIKVIIYCESSISRILQLFYDIIIACIIFDDDAIDVIPLYEKHQ